MKKLEQLAVDVAAPPAMHVGAFDTMGAVSMATGILDWNGVGDPSGQPSREVTTAGHR